MLRRNDGLRDGIRRDSFLAFTGNGEGERIWPNAEADEKWDLVLRVTGSGHFRRSARLRDFLLYVSDCTLRNDLEHTREQDIGCRVFGRSPEYNPAEDNIVRVEARQLRKRLQDYFGSEGSNEPVIILIPKGSYAPVFVRRDPVAPATAAEAPEPAAITEVPVVAPATSPRRDTGRAHWVAIALILAAGALGSMWLWAHNGATAAQTSKPFPWSALFDRDKQTCVVLPDAAINMLQDLVGHRVTLAEYSNQTYIAKLRSLANELPTRATFDLIASRRYTSFGAASLIQKILLQGAGLEDRIVINQARNLNIRNFKTDNLVLIGSSYSNPWVELFEPKLNFQMEHDPATQETRVRNKFPRGNEAPVYPAVAGTAYTAIALMPNLSGAGNVLIIAGSNVEGTEAGGEFLADPGNMARAWSELGLKQDHNVRHFEMVLRSRSLDGATNDTEPIAYRLLPK